MKHLLLSLAEQDIRGRIGWGPAEREILAKFLNDYDDLLTENDALRFALNTVNHRLARHEEVIELSEEDWKEVKGG